jgi:hypothetical protein
LFIRVTSFPAFRRSSIPARTCAVIAATCSPPATAIPPTSQGSLATSHLRSPPYLPEAAPASRRPGVTLAPAAGLPRRAAGRSAAHIARVFAMRGRRAYGTFRDGVTAIVKGRSRASLSSQDSGNRLRVGRSWLPRAVPRGGSHPCAVPATQAAAGLAEGQRRAGGRPAG